MDFLIGGGAKPAMLRDSEELPGVARVAKAVRRDIERVTGAALKESTEAAGIGKTAIIYGSLGACRYLDKLEARGAIDLGLLRGKRECFIFRVVRDPLPGIESALVIAGSDKRGAIYGLFHLSELMGVSPLVNWALVEPARKKRVVLDEGANLVSKEPSVRYRGFFINDEWPAFGTWANKRFGGLNARMYEEVFMLLLRLKGNYLWPAMWASVFSEDGPGRASAELADELGVVIGTSHHEPCMRHGEEYSRLRGPSSPYGDAWNYRANPEGIRRFWEDGLKRNAPFEKVITLGMRGERDSAIMGEKSSVADNRELLKDVIAAQNRLIEQCVDPDLRKVPRMLALYKEVEDFFFGSDGEEGLLGYPELDDVILLLSDDNHGNLRSLPDDAMRAHPGGFGIYYHFDYHGGPVSYEWVNSSALPKVWEQMTTAYAHGVREMWIVNVGDICTQEFPLSFFLDLAYDYEAWGASGPDAPERYTARWVERQFGDWMPEPALRRIGTLLSEYTRIGSMRRPEAMRADTYHAANYREAERMLERVERALAEADALRKLVPAKMLPAFIELVHYPAVGLLNVQRMQLCAGLNARLASLGRNDAAPYAAKVDECLARDRAIIDEYHAIAGGAFYGMGLSEHIGFTKWNAEECQYPLVFRRASARGQRAIVSIVGDEQSTQGGDWTGRTLVLRDFERPDSTQAAIDIASGGEEPLDYELSTQAPWLSLSPAKGRTSLADRIVVGIDRKAMRGETRAEILVKAVGRKIKIEVRAEALPEGLDGSLPPMCFVEAQGYVAMEAEHFSRDEASARGRFERVPSLGKTLSTMKAFPADAYFKPGKDAPSLEYRFVASREGPYALTLFMAPSNPAKHGSPISYGLSVNEGPVTMQHAVKAGWKVGDRQEDWERGVLDAIRRHTVEIDAKKGMNILRVYAATPCFALERLLLHPAGEPVLESYLGPPESYYEKMPRSKA
jgi:hypothetical protein